MIGKGKAVAAMTIRKRLFISNLLMILVPVCIAALIAAGCAGAVWYTVRFGGGLGFDDSEDFYQVSTGIAELAEQSLQDSNAQQTLDSITALLDRKAVSLRIEQDGQPYYAYGTASPADDALSKAAALLGDDVRLSDGARSLYAHRVQIGGTDYRTLIFGSTQQVSYTGLKLVAAAAMLLVLAAALAAVLYSAASNSRSRCWRTACTRSATGIWISASHMTGRMNSPRSVRTLTRWQSGCAGRSSRRSGRRKAGKS